MHFDPRAVALILSAVFDFLLLPILLAVKHELSRTMARSSRPMNAVADRRTFAKYMRIFHRRELVIPVTSIRSKSGDSNTIISISVALQAGALRVFALPASRRTALSSAVVETRMAPAGRVYALPFFNLYSAINLFDTPVAVAAGTCTLQTYTLRRL